jgi:hypothetical protein
MDDESDYYSEVAMGEKKSGVDFWCYLMINYNPHNKINTHIGKSRNPDAKVNMWNAKCHKRVNIQDGEIPSIWMLVMVLGPFETESDARILKVIWKNRSRGIGPRKVKGIDLAEEYNRKNPLKKPITSYDKDLDPRVSRDLLQ